jgi:hypothetical protein
MEIALKIHVEASETGAPIWWIESDDLPGLTASADTLPELRAALSALLDEFGSELAEDAGHPGEQIAIASERLIPSAPAEPSLAARPAARVIRDGKPEERRTSPVHQVLISA